jgi:hypothetical protein
MLLKTLVSSSKQICYERIKDINGFSSCNQEF